jgi:hypothetical protein
MQTYGKDSPEIDLCRNGEIIFKENFKSIQWRKKNVFNKWY